LFLYNIKKKSNLETKTCTLIWDTNLRSPESFSPIGRRTAEKFQLLSVPDYRQTTDRQTTDRNHRKAGKTIVRCDLPVETDKKGNGNQLKGGRSAAPFFATDPFLTDPSQTDPFLPDPSPPDPSSPNLSPPDPSPPDLLPPDLSRPYHHCPTDHYPGPITA
jgi:hypothetical protein